MLICDLPPFVCVSASSDYEFNTLINNNTHKGIPIMVSFSKICPCICDYPQPLKSAILDLDPDHFGFKGGIQYM